MRREWAERWYIPALGLVGMTGPAAFSFASGVFMEDITREFGWSRMQYASALMLQMLIAVLVGPFAGRLLDKIGPRRMILGGIIPFMISFSLFGLSNGSIGLWWAFSLLLGCLAAGIGPPGWIAGTVRSFDTARGLALGVVLAGTGLASAIWPILAAYAASRVGWKLAFPLIGIGWSMLILPLVYLFFHPKDMSHQSRPDAPVLAASTMAAVFRDPVFWLLLCAGCLFVSVNMSIIITIVPILRSQGLDIAAAVAIAGVMGVCSVIGRVVTGFLLDRVPARALVLVAFSLPLVVLTLLITCPGNPTALLIAAAFLGYGAGAETDVITYLCSRRFDATVFGTAIASLFAGFAVCAGIGPMVAGRIYDAFGSYDPYLIGGIPVILGSVVLAQLSFARDVRMEPARV